MLTLQTPLDCKSDCQKQEEKARSDIRTIQASKLTTVMTQFGLISGRQIKMPFCLYQIKHE